MKKRIIGILCTVALLCAGCGVETTTTITEATTTTTAYTTTTTETTTTTIIDTDDSNPYKTIENFITDDNIVHVTIKKSTEDESIIANISFTGTDSAYSIVEYFNRCVETIVTNNSYNASAGIIISVQKDGEDIGSFMYSPDDSGNFTVLYGSWTNEEYQAEMDKLQNK